SVLGSRKDSWPRIFTDVTDVMFGIRGFCVLRNEKFTTKDTLRLRSGQASVARRTRRENKSLTTRARRITEENSITAEDAEIAEKKGRSVISVAALYWRKITSGH